MIKLNNLYKTLFIIIPVILGVFFVYNNYINKPVTERPAKNLDFTDINQHTNNRDNIAELRSLLTVIKTSIDNLNEDNYKNKAATEKRLRKIEQSIEDMTADGNINPNNINNSIIVEESLSAAPEQSQYRRQRAYDQMSSINAALAGEARDDNWASEMEQTMMVASQKEQYQGSTFYSPTCKSTFCKIEVSHKDNDSRDNFENMRREIPNSYHIQHYEEGGELRSVLYIIKRGEEANNVIFNTLNETS